MKKKLLSILLAVSLTASLCLPAIAAELEEDVRGKDLSAMDLRDQEKRLYELTYDWKTRWPSVDKLPEGFDPQALMEWSKDPGLGVRWLHAMGYTGKGSNIAYIDQGLGKVEHPELSGIDLHYYTTVMESYGQGNDRAYHGCAVLDMVAGKDVGTAPDASVYFVAEPSWLADQTTRADAVREVIRINSQLPETEKIKVIGISNNLRDDIPNRKILEEAVAEAKAAGIFVMFCGEFQTAQADPMANRDDLTVYHPLSWGDRKIVPYQNGRLYVPVDRTYAGYVTGNESDYIRDYYGGLSWTAPYVTGVMAIGQQIDPTLTGEKMLKLLKETAYKPTGITSGGLIDPVAFAKRVAKDAGKELSPLGNYTLCLYNSDKVSSTDLAALKSYTESVTMFGEQAAVLLDVKGKSTATQVYETIRAYRDKSSGILAGVQIFGTAADVPAFEISYEADMGANGIDRMGTYYSDYFYGSLENDAAKLKNFSIYKNFSEKLEADLIQDWPVARLPLTKGDYKAYFDKANDYAEQVGEADHPRLVNFDGPIFRSQNHSDDLGWFLQNRMDKEFRILKAEDYTVYGNQQGLYPVNAKVAGDITPENLKSENGKGVMDLLINSHGQKANIDRAFFVNHADAEQYRDTARHIQTGENGIDEVRVSLVNTDNINNVLGENYYNLMTWTCNNAEGLDTKNLAYTALKGNAVNVFAATHIISNNGVNNKASITQMKNNNFTYFYYSFLKYYYGGKSRGESFWLAKRDYVEGCLANPSVGGEGNYQFNLNNALVYQHLGLLHIPGDSVIAPSVQTLPVLGKFQNNNAMLPMRALFEAVGFQVGWDGATQTITATRGADVILMYPGQTTYSLNGEPRTLPVAPFAEDGTTYVPVRAVSEAAGCEVVWHGEDYTVTVKGGGFEFLVQTDLTPGI